jgi:MFS family permease
MNTRNLWSRILVIAGCIAMVVGAIDPMEGSLLILPGSGMVALGTFIAQGERRLIVYRVWVFILIAIGVGAFWALSEVGGFGGSSGHSMWWAVLILPYPLGWLMGIWGSGTPRWMLWLGIVVGLWYISLLVTIHMNPNHPGANIWSGIFIAAFGLLIIGGCVYRLWKSTTPRWLLPAVVALGFVTITVLYFTFLPRTESVTFRIVAPAARQVFIAGTFNGWNPRQYPLSEQSQGQWQTTISLPTGRHEYKFIVDSEWVQDVNNPNRAQLQPPLHGYNSVINVGSQDSISSKR